MTEADPISAGSNAGSEPRVTRDMFGSWKPVNVAQLQDEQDGDKRSDTGDGLEPLYAGIIFPTMRQFLVKGADLLIKQPEQRKTVFPDGAGDWIQGEGG